MDVRAAKGCLFLLGLIVTCGCSYNPAPKISISHPMVFTMSQVMEAQQTLDPNQALDAALVRNFLSPSGDNTGLLNGDSALDSSQRTTDLLSQVASVAALRIQLGAQTAAATQPSSSGTAKNASSGSQAGSGIPSQASPPADSSNSSSGAATQSVGQTIAASNSKSSTTQPSAQAGQLASLDQFKSLLMSNGQGISGDSPFDHLDRISDFYTALLLKELLFKYPDGHHRRG